MANIITLYDRGQRERQREKKEEEKRKQQKKLYMYRRAKKVSGGVSRKTHKN